MKEHYLISKDDPIFKEIERKFSATLEHLVQKPKKSFAFTVAAEVVSSNQTDLMNEIVLLAQHKKVWIDRILFGIRLKFKKSPENEELYEYGEWQMEKDIQLWIRKIGEGISVSCFFLREWEARFLSIAGDILADDRMKIVTRRDDRMQLETSLEDQRVIIDRLTESSKMFLHYCHPSGFDPKQAIEAVLAEFEVPPSLEFKIIKMLYDEEVRRGIFPYAVKRSEENKYGEKG